MLLTRQRSASSEHPPPTRRATHASAWPPRSRLCTLIQHQRQAGHASLKGCSKARRRIEERSCSLEHAVSVEPVASNSLPQASCCGNPGPFPTQVSPPAKSFLPIRAKITLAVTTLSSYHPTTCSLYQPPASSSTTVHRPMDSVALIEATSLRCCGRTFNTRQRLDYGKKEVEESLARATEDGLRAKGTSAFSYFDVSPPIPECQVYVGTSHEALLHASSNSNGYSSTFPYRCPPCNVSIFSLVFFPALVWSETMGSSRALPDFALAHHRTPLSSTFLCVTPFASRSEYSFCLIAAVGLALTLSPSSARVCSLNRQDPGRNSRLVFAQQTALEGFPRQGKFSASPSRTPKTVDPAASQLVHGPGSPFLSTNKDGDCSHSQTDPTIRPATR
ncbi:hypothetical protein NMY22_g10123 [Coprinellus aureogranulatus]|nr:hypothetical protein NMY22_g10123 [Coprinellus aureogranulatus]